MAALIKVVLALKPRSKVVVEFPPQFRKDPEARCVAGVSLQRGPERPLSEAVKVKPGFHWRPQDVGDARAMRYLPRRAADRVWNLLKREKYVAVKKAEKS